MKINVIGATGDVVSRVITEAFTRGHNVTAVVRNEASLSKLPENVIGQIADLSNPSDVAKAMYGNELAISSLRTLNGGPHTVISDPDFRADGIVPTARASFAQSELCMSMPKLIGPMQAALPFSNRV